MNGPSMQIPGSASPEAFAATRERLQRRRRTVNAIALTMSLAAMAFGLLWLVWILYTTLSLGVGGLSVALPLMIYPELDGAVQLWTP